LGDQKNTPHIEAKRGGGGSKGKVLPQALREKKKRKILAAVPLKTWGSVGGSVEGKREKGGAVFGLIEGREKIIF